MIRTDEEILADLEFTPNRVVRLQAVVFRPQMDVPHIWEVTTYGRRLAEVWHCEEVSPSYRPTLGETVPLLATKGLQIVRAWQYLGRDQKHEDFDLYIATAEMVMH